jgi:hypothetical protein
VEPRLEHPLAAVMRKVDVFVPLLTARRGETSSIVEATVNRFLRRDRRNSLGCNFADQ